MAGVVALALPGAGHSAVRHVRATTIRHDIAHGRPVAYSHVVVTGRLRFPLDVPVPVELERVTFTAPVVAAATAFDRLVSFTGSTFRHGADFGAATFDGPVSFAGLHTSGTTAFDDATFRGAALFGGAQFGGPVSFAAAEIDGEARFRNATFGNAATFASTSFRGGSEFTTATFADDARFGAANFGDVADFSGSEVDGRALFDAARFAALADFTGRQFDGPTASFFGARFEDGATFLDAHFQRNAHFDLAEAGGDMVFDGAIFEHQASFSTVRFLGDTSFSQAQLGGITNFDQAVLHRLDLDGATFGSKVSLYLPQPKGTTGHLDELRFDPGDVSHIGPNAALEESVTRAERESALALVEAAARRGNDTSAANRAYAMRQTLVRHDERPPVQVLNYTVWWGFAGYLVSPWHQVIAILILLLVFATARIVWARIDPEHHPRLSFGQAIRRSWAALWRLDIRQGSAAASFEATAYKLVVVVLLLNLANVWPPVHDVVKGVFL
ncbi:MAG TPA: pentapeptide repeat-containing protein [Gaiellaceae bacterium]|nr:pentapeptide repeat-containing protein [Gaiellaceae bacterium]